MCYGRSHRREGIGHVRGQVIGSTIAAVFGVIYVFANSGELPAGAAWTLRAAAVAVVAVVAVRVLTASRAVGHGVEGAVAGPVRDGDSSRPAPFGRGYWLIVVAEVVAILVGVRLLAGPLDRPEAGVAWVSVAVGVHFFALAAHFRLSFFHLLGVLVTACGVAGLALAFTTTWAAAVAVTGGVVPGFVLLGFAVWGTGRHPRWSGAADEVTLRPSVQ